LVEDPEPAGAFSYRAEGASSRRVASVSSWTTSGLQHVRDDATYTVKQVDLDYFEDGQ
jgi:hypothetical protein